MDAGPLYAYLDVDDRDHADSLALLERLPGPLAVPMLVVSEVACVAEKRLGAIGEVRFLSDFVDRNFIAVPVADEDWIRITELVHRYRDLPLGTVDASVVAAAERLGIRTIATLDRRHFSVVRPRHVPAFELIP